MVNAVILDKIDKNTLKISFISTTVFMLLAYMYSYTNGSFLFDAAMIYRGEIGKFHFSSDKIFLNFLQYLDYGISLPWFSGILSIFFMAISVYLIVDYLQIENKLSIFLVSGFCALHTSIITQQVLVGGNYTGEIALFFSCIAVWFLDRISNKKLGILLCLFSITVSAGIYGAYVSMSSSLMLIKIILNVFAGKRAKDNWKLTIEYAVLFIFGLVVYYILLRFILLITNSTLQSYQNEDTLASLGGVLRKIFIIKDAYIGIINYYLGRTIFLPKFIIKIFKLLNLTSFCLGILFLKNNWPKISDRIANFSLFLCIIAILPLSINLIYVLSSGAVHYLMNFTYVIPYIFICKIVDINLCENRKKIYSIAMKVVICVMGVFLYYSIVMANAVMVRMNHMYVEAEAICTNMLERIESCENFNGYENVIFIGALQYNSYYKAAKETDSDILNGWLGAGNGVNVNGVNWGSWLKKFMMNILNSNLLYTHYDSLIGYISSCSVPIEHETTINSMKAYPLKDSVKKVDNTIYVYLGEI